MKILRSIPAAFSMYSRIPVPGFRVKDEDIKNCIMFLPLIGAVIGAVMFFLIRLLTYLPAPVSVRAMILVTVPLVITGGFHIDGFMDTVDARSSLKTPEERLEILKDAHIGAFAVVRLLILGIIAVSSLVVIINLDSKSEHPLYVLACATFMVSRALAALTSVYMEKAKNEGMLAEETKESGNACTVALMLQLIAPVSLMAYLNAVYTGIILAAFIVFTLFYRHMTKNEFGGVTGDMAGYYVAASEVFALAVLAVAAMLLIGRI